MKSYQILCPEYVPLENKGEEAIMRGMADVLFPDGNVEFHVFDLEAHDYYFVDGLHVYPGKWFYSKWRSKEFGLGMNFHKIYSSGCSLLRNLLSRIFPQWLYVPQLPLLSIKRSLGRIGKGGQHLSKKDRLIKQIYDCDFLIAGHDGAFDEYDCHVIDLMHRKGMGFGVFGTSLKPNVRNRVIIEIFRRTLAKSKFIFCRNEIAVSWGNRVFEGKIQLALSPDPAFGMKPAPKEIALTIIETEGLSEFFAKPVIMFTVCEPSPIARHCFRAITDPDRKLDEHRKFIARFVRFVAENYDVNILFLPHAIGPGPDLDDRLVAREVLRIAGLDEKRARLLETEYSAKQLKALIREADLLIAERIHSIIGAVGVHTPILSLGSETDTRVQGIVGEMLESRDLIFLLNDPKLEDLCTKFSSVWEMRGQVSERFKRLSEEFSQRLEAAAREIRSHIVGSHEKGT